MPFSLRSSSFYVIACLCGSGLVYAQEPLHGKKTKFPFYDHGESFYLASDWKIYRIDGGGFANSFLGNQNNFNLSGNNKVLSFTQCIGPSSASLISAGQDLTIANFSSLILRDNSSQSEKGLISGETISISQIRSLIFSGNSAAYPTLTTTGSTTTTANDFHGSVLHAKTKLNITGVTKTFSFVGNSANFGAAICCDDNATCSIQDNKAPILFSNNRSVAGGGAIYNGSISINNNLNNISFINNGTLDGLSNATPSLTTKPLPGQGCGGAICAAQKTVTLADNQGITTFALNTAAKSAGAIYAQTLSIDAAGPMLFEQNTAQENGGAICARDLSIEANKDITFVGNRSSKGGAVYISKDIGPTGGTASSFKLFANEGNIIFNDNVLNSQPGVRNAVTISKDTNSIQIAAQGNSKVVFRDPIVQTNDNGAIVYSLLSYQDNIVYSLDHNQSSGVIYSDNSDTLSESKKPEIENVDEPTTFDLSIPEFDTPSSPVVQPTLDKTEVESIDESTTFDLLTPESKTSPFPTIQSELNLSLKPTHSDSRKTYYRASTTPPTTSAPTISLNKLLDSNTQTDGMIVFSSDTLSPLEKLVFQNFTSVLLGKIELKSGKLLVTDNAKLHVLAFTSSVNGLLILGSNAGVDLVVDINNAAYATDNFSINNLGCDVASFLKENSAAATLNAGAKTVTITGAASIYSDDDVALYDTALLSSNVSFPMVIPASTATSGVTISGFTPGDMEVPEHYGFQGSWSSSTTPPLLAPTPNGGIPSGPANTIYVKWTAANPNHGVYLLDPARRGELVANSLWSSFSAMRTFSESLDEIKTNEKDGIISSVKALGHYSQCSKKNDHEGFYELFGGYHAALSIHYVDDASLGIAFGQLHGKLKSRPYDYKISEHVTLATLFGRFPIITRCSETRLSWEVCYAYNHNNMTTKYKLNTPQPRQSKGRWHNNSYYVQLSAEHPFLEQLAFIRCLADRFNLSGFVGAEFIGGWQQAFTETGDLIRNFHRGKGYLITTPVGVRSEWFAIYRCMPIVLNIRAAFKPNFCQVNPHTVMDIVANKIDHSIYGAQLPRYSASIGCNSSIKLSRKTSFSFDYNADIKGKASSHRLSTGIQRIF